MDEYSGSALFSGIQLIRESFGTLKENASKAFGNGKENFNEMAGKGREKSFLEDHSILVFLFGTDGKSLNLG